MGSAVPGAGTAEGAPFLAIVGHIDEIGLIVTHIEDGGFLRFVGVGGWDAQILVGQRVEICTRDGVVPGVVGKKPIHLLKDEERKKVPSCASCTSTSAPATATTRAPGCASATWR